MKNILLCTLLAIALTGCQARSTEGPADVEKILTASNQTGTQAKAEALITDGHKQLIQGKVKDAVEKFRAAIETEPSYAPGYLALSEVMVKLKQYDQSIVILQNATQRVQGNGSIYYMLGLSHQMKGNLAPAMAATQRSAEIFQKQGDKENLKRSLNLIKQLMDQARPVPMENSVAANFPAHSDTVDAPDPTVSVSTSVEPPAPVNKKKKSR